MSNWEGEAIARVLGISWNMSGATAQCLVTIVDDDGHPFPMEIDTGYPPKYFGMHCYTAINVAVHQELVRRRVLRGGK